MSVDKQSHYAELGIEPIEVMKANMTMEEYQGFLKGNIEKYLWRKKGQDLKDFEKIVVYSKWLVEAEKAKQNKNRQPSLFGGDNAN